MDKQKYFPGTGRRKTAVAQVKLSPGNGAVIINDTPYEQWRPHSEHREEILKALKVTNNLGKFNVDVKVTGGGVAGQSDAIRHGIARALAAFDESLKHQLREYGLLTRDPRAKERKKPGLKRARKAPQYTKR